MDVGLIAAVVGAVATVVGVGVGVWQARIARRSESSKPPDRGSGRRVPEDEAESRPSLERARPVSEETGSRSEDTIPPFRWADQGVSAAVAVDRLPAHVRGRDDVLAELQEQLRRGGLAVLIGTGGIGKSTIARELVRRMPAPPESENQPGRWEVTATPGRLTEGLITVARALNATEAELEAIGASKPSGSECLWRLLDRAPRGWLLIFDNADEPELLAEPKVSNADPPKPADGTGWARTSRRGLVLVSSRDSGEDRQEDVWPARAILYRAERLTESEAAQILRDEAPMAGDELQALALARRLGGLPLVLHLVGRYLNSKYSEHAGFEAYLNDLEANVEVIRLLDRYAGDPKRTERVMVMFTWELSLDALTRRGLPQTRPFLRLPSCYAPTLPIPVSMLKAELLEPLLRASIDLAEYPEALAVPVGQVLMGLDSLGLIEATSLSDKEAGNIFGAQEEQWRGLGIRRALLVHPVIADTNRVYLLNPRPADPPGDLVRQTAVKLLATILDSLTEDRPGTGRSSECSRLISRPLSPILPTGSITTISMS